MFCELQFFLKLCDFLGSFLAPNRASRVASLVRNRAPVPLLLLKIIKFSLQLAVSRFAELDLLFELIYGLVVSTGLSTVFELLFKCFILLFGILKVLFYGIIRLFKRFCVFLSLLHGFFGFVDGFLQRLCAF